MIKTNNDFSRYVEKTHNLYKIPYRKIKVKEIKKKMNKREFLEKFLKAFIKELRKDEPRKTTKI